MIGIYSQLRNPVFVLILVGALLVMIAVTQFSALGVPDANIALAGLAAGLGLRLIMEAISLWSTRQVEYNRSLDYVEPETEATIAFARRLDSDLWESEQAIREVQDALDLEKDPRPTAVMGVKAHLSRYPTRREAAITLARFYAERWKQDRISGLKEAIAILSSFAEAKLGKFEQDADRAAALYNITCYLMEIYGERSGSGAPQEELLAYVNEALAHLRQSIELDPANAAEAKEDEDLSALRSDPRFRSVVD